MSRLVPDLDPNEGISREEVAMLFGFSDDPDAGIHAFNAAAETVPFSLRQNPDTGEDEYRLGDVEAVHREWKRGPSRPSAQARRASAPVTFADDDAGLDAVLLSADAGGKSTKGIRVADAAKQAGLTEEEMSARLLGSVQLRVVDGDLCVGLDDLNRLRKEGVITKVTNSTEPAKPELFEDPLAPPVDPEVERRTKAMARELGIDLTPATRSNSTDDQPKGRQNGAPITARADDGEGYRLGRPRRWGQT